jgi:hypothetical protein
MDNTIPTPSMSPEEWIAVNSCRRQPLARHRLPRIKSLFKLGSRNELPDIPFRHDGIMRHPSGAVWIPEPTPSWRTGLFGRPTRSDWRNHAMAGAAQVRALAREAAHLQHELDAAITNKLNEPGTTVANWQR